MSYAAALAKGIALEQFKSSEKTAVIEEKKIAPVQVTITGVKRKAVIIYDSDSESEPEACLNCNVLASVGCDCDDESYSD
jgi:hypothetical protein